MEFITNSAEETARAAGEFAKSLVPGSVVALVGDLGAGKTAFVKGALRCFGYENEVLSPTYTLVNEYDTSPPVYHFDVYRLQEISASDAEWLDEYLFGDGICLIEWADNIKELLPDNTVRVEILKNPDMGDNYREIKIC